MTKYNTFVASATAMTVCLLMLISGCERTVQLSVRTLDDNGSEKEQADIDSLQSGQASTEGPHSSLPQPKPSMESPPKPKPEDQVVNFYTEFLEIAEFYNDKNATSTRDFAEDMTRMKKAFEELEKIALNAPDCTVAHEAVAEIAFELALIMEGNIKSESAAAGFGALLPYTIDSLRDTAWKTFRKAASQGSQNAYTYDRLARLKLIKTGRWEDTELVENILESMRLAPENGMSIRMLVLALLNSSFINSGAFDNELVRVLPMQQGNAKAELERSLDFLEGEWEVGQKHAERAAILGYIDVGSQREMMRNAKLKGMLRAALRIGPFERRNKATAKK